MNKPVMGSYTPKEAASDYFCALIWGTLQDRSWLGLSALLVKLSRNQTQEAKSPLFFLRIVAHCSCNRNPKRDAES